MAPKRRAERYEMQLPIRYHLSDPDRWADGRTVNVSHNGVLACAADGAPVPAGPVDFVMALPPCGVVPLAQIRCSGRLVRVLQASGERAFAFSIESYRFVKPGDGEGATR